MHAILLLSFSLLGQTSLDDGSLVFLERCNFFVERYTSAPIGHVAIAVNENDHTWIYEATPGHVRRLTWAAYRDELSAINGDRTRWERDTVITWVLAPRTPLNAAQRSDLKIFLESQLDRRYSVRGIVRGKTGDGIHCAELASQALNTIGQIEVEECHKQSPAAVMALAQRAYQPPRQVEIPLPEAEPAWCERAWHRWTRAATMCRWSWGEAWSFCW
jgi:hypothetical protein